MLCTVLQEIPIAAPVAPPRLKRLKDNGASSVREFRAHARDRQEQSLRALFNSEHRTQEGADLLPVGRTVAFDCPLEGAVREGEVFVGITGEPFTVFGISSVFNFAHKVS